MVEVKIFAESVARRIKDYMPPAYSDMECQVTEGQKNNGVLLTGVQFCMPGEGLVPIIYMEPYYDEVKGGKSFDNVMIQIAAVADKCIMAGKDLTEIPVESFEKAKEHLYLTLINTNANRRMLSEMPHMEVEDLSAICNVRVGDIGEIKITDDYLKRWNIGKEQLFSAAFDNMRESEYVLQGMQDVVNELMFEMPTPENLLETPEKRKEDSLGLYVLSNVMRNKGASVLLCSDVMEKISQMFPEGFYILPSSIHEVLVVSKDMGVSPKEIGKMVREINRTEVGRDEVLSDHIYEYDREQGKICKVPDSIEKKREQER